MKFLYIAQAVLRGPLLNLRHWIRHSQVTAHNPHAFVSFPVVFQYDEVISIQLGKGVVIGPFSEIAVYTKSVFSRVSGQLIVEDRAVIGSHANVRATGGMIRIGKNAMIGQHVSLIASNHKVSSVQIYRDAPWDEDKTDISIDENVWIGANVTVLPSCSIGKNSVVGAGSVVTKSIPANELWAGVPARKIRDINYPEKTEVGAVTVDAGLD